MESGVERFVLVLTDKAVKPTSIMGAKKHFAELIIQGLSMREVKQGFQWCALVISLTHLAQLCRYFASSF